MSFDDQLARIKTAIEGKNKNPNKAAEEDVLRSIEGNSVTKSHALSRAYYRFSLVEKRIMEALISKLHPQRFDNNTQLLELKATEYSKAFNVSTQAAYRDIEKAAQSLMRTVIRTEAGEQHGEITEFTVMSVAKYREKEGVIRCAFNPYITPHLIGMRAKFSSYPLKNAVDFKSSYTWRLYEILVSWAQPKSKTQGRFVGWIKNQSVDELRDMLGVPKSYTWGMFNKQCLIVAISELKEKSQIEVRVERVKTSRKITHLNIDFMEDEQITINLKETRA